MSPKPAWEVKSASDSAMMNRRNTGHLRGESNDASILHVSSCFQTLFRKYSAIQITDTGSTEIGGEGGIRTLDRLLTYTHFPGVLLKPLGHLSGRLQCLSSAWSDSGPNQKRLPQALRARENIRNRRYGANPAGPGVQGSRGPALPAAASPRPIWTEPNRRRPAPQSPHDPPQEHRPG